MDDKQTQSRKQGESRSKPVTTLNAVMKAEIVTFDRLEDGVVYYNITIPQNEEEARFQFSVRQDGVVKGHVFYSVDKPQNYYQFIKAAIDYRTLKQVY